MLTDDARKDLMTRLANEHGSDAAINAILASAFYLNETTPVVARGTATIEMYNGGLRPYDEHPGQLRCYTHGKHTGYLIAPNYMNSIDDASRLVELALGREWIIEMQVRADGSQARLHEFDPPCRRTGWHRADPGSNGAATAIVLAVLEATALKQ